MKLEFDPNLEYQINAIDSTIGLFETQIKNTYTVTLRGNAVDTIPNKLDLTEKKLLDNLQSVQKTNNIRPDNILYTVEGEIRSPGGSRKHSFYNYSIDMETGTGKTYVYLRTVLELKKHYGFKKFIIVVPSIAIKEGVLKTLQITKQHFKQLYKGINYNYAVYNSSKINLVKQFAYSDALEILIMTIDSFNKASNIINQPTDRLQGETPITFIQATNPILILDEPQNMESEISKNALTSMCPLFTLRYSATHRNPYNVLYRLSPFEAYRQGLVKKIEVSSVVTEDTTLRPFIVVEDIETKKQTLTATLRIQKLMKNGTVKERHLKVKSGDSLYEKTGRIEYNGYDISEIDYFRGIITFKNGEILSKGQEFGADKEAIFEVQIRDTIEKHLKKQIYLKQFDIKVLTLFFIDRVDNYAKKDGIIRVLFNRIFNELKKQYPDWEDKEPEQVQAAYFAQRRNRQGDIIYEDSKTGESKKDEKTYNLIMRDKERLLSFNEPVSFIFSHSALREGWDNPNIYQICTLNQTVSLIKKRQEVGRGIRIAVNQSGKRTFDADKNILTVIANESYEHFVSQYQLEIAEEYIQEIEARYGKPWSQLSESERLQVITEYGEGVFIPPPPSNAKERKTVNRVKSYELKPEFRELWTRIKHKTKYRVTIDSDKLVKDIIKELETVVIQPPRVTITRIQLNVDDDENIFNALQLSTVKTIKSLAGKYPLPNLIDTITELLEYTTPSVKLTRKTIYEIIKQTPNKIQDMMLQNPNEYARETTRIIKEKLVNQLVEGIKYTKINEWYEMTQFKAEIESWEKYLKPSTKSVYDEIICDSNIERDFVDGLEAMEEVLLYIKLPNWFTVPTPIGTYNPDWAILWQEKDTHGKPTEKKLYLVYETKGSRLSELRPGELRKIKCGEQHFLHTLKLDDYNSAQTVTEMVESIQKIKKP